MDQRTYCLSAGTLLFLIYFASLGFGYRTPVFLSTWAWILCALTFYALAVSFTYKGSVMLSSIAAAAVIRTCALQIVVFLGTIVLVLTKAEIFRTRLLEYGYWLVVTGNILYHIFPMVLMGIFLVNYARGWRSTLRTVRDSKLLFKVWLLATSFNSLIFTAAFTFLNPTSLYGTRFDTVVYLVPMIVISMLFQCIVFYV